MKTQEFLDKINGAIADAFAPILNTKNQYLGACHDIVGQAIKDKLPMDISYSSWYLRPSYESFGIAGHSIELFRLETSGSFVRYKNRDEVYGRWIKAPFYTCLFPDCETIDEVLRMSMFTYLSKRVIEQKERVAKMIDDLQIAENYLQEMTDKLQLYA